MATFAKYFIVTAYRGCGENSIRFATAKECREKCADGGKANATSALTGSDAVFVPRGNSHDQLMKAEKCGSNFLIPNAKYLLASPNCPSYHHLTNGVCCPTRDYVCSQRDDSVSFAKGIEARPRFAWNHEVKSCERFSYFGANGNYNNFPSFYSCFNYCKDSKKVEIYMRNYESTTSAGSGMIVCVLFCSLFSFTILF